MYRYLQGGNPPHIEGVYLLEGRKHPRLVAFWPAGFKPTNERLEAVVTAVQAREDSSPLSRQHVKQLIA